MFDMLVMMARTSAAKANMTYLKQVTAAYERMNAELPPGVSLDPFSLAAWGEFEKERDSRAAEFPVAR